ncbi:MAG: sulfatase-like hydrolase/transferase [Deltaproteobacteria bacterium]|nr:sulfatase-like hydrolase/transferase [Deltaproteobacteria bacterium]MBW2678077.1 sulfatase-like hydrolase/transferase [Deltaproteobacteria bacterium]
MKKSIIKLLRNSNCRRKKLTAAVLLLTTVIICFALPPNIWGHTADAPNIIFILTDDHRWDALSILGHPMVQTPNLDRLCREGVHFKNAFVTTSLCSPSRTSFLPASMPLPTA